MTSDSAPDTGRVYAGGNTWSGDRRSCGCPARLPDHMHLGSCQHTKMANVSQAPICTECSYRGKDDPKGHCSHCGARREHPQVEHTFRGIANL